MKSIVYGHRNRLVAMMACIAVGIAVIGAGTATNKSISSPIHNSSYSATSGSSNGYSAISQRDEIARLIEMDDVMRAAEQLPTPTKTIVVTPGDTLLGISRRHGVAAQRIAEFNGLNIRSIQIGQHLIIPPR